MLAKHLNSAERPIYYVVGPAGMVNGLHTMLDESGVDDDDIRTETLVATERLKSKSPPTVLTVGHSTRTIEAFIHLLQAHGVTHVIDVRTVPRSRHNPQFNRDILTNSLQAAGIGYLHMAELGGLRHRRRDSINAGWRNNSFRGYADYMLTPDFHKAIEQLIQLNNKDRIALMCAEAVPWRCHRSLIADALLIRGIKTEHIMSASRRQVHTLTPFVKIQGARITYPAKTDVSAIPHRPSSR